MEHNLGLLETMYWEFGKIPLWDYHFFRLYKAAISLKIKSELLTKDRLYSHILSVVKPSNYKETKKIRLHLVNNQGLGNIIIHVEDYKRTLAEDARLGLATGVMKPLNAWSNFKIDQRDIYIHAQEVARTNNWEDALLLNEHGNVAEGSISNVFWREEEDGPLYTVPLSEGCVDGVMRRYLMYVRPVEEKVLDLPTLDKATEIYLTNGVRGIIPIKYFNGRNLESELTKFGINNK